MTLAEQYIHAITTGNNTLAHELEKQLDDEGRRDEARLTSPTALISAAIYYARQGIAVFPVTPRAKTPLGRLAPNGLKDATTNEAKIREWWQAVPDANIGAPTGITFDVVDIDGRGGIISIYGQGRQLPTEIGHTLTSRDAGHHVMIAPTGRGNTTKMLPGVDYRGAGGYVLLPPSIGENGRRYRWTRPLAVQS